MSEELKVYEQLLLVSRRITITLWNGAQRNDILVGSEEQVMSDIYSLCQAR